MAAHDNAWRAWEASIKLCVAADPPADASALARAPLGAWVRARCAPDLRLEDEALLRAHALLTDPLEGDDVPDPTRRSVSAQELLHALPAYRNRLNIGHGPAKGRSFYLAAADVLLDGIVAAWRAGVFIPPSRRLVYVDALQRDREGRLLAHLYDLGGEHAELLDRFGTEVPESVRAERLHLRDADGRYTSIHPLLVFHREWQATFFFNRFTRHAEYVDFATGVLLSGERLEDELPGLGEAARAALAVDPGATDDDRPDAAAAASDPADFGDYRLLGKLGEGGMGVVHLAEQKSLGRRVALKTLLPGRIGDAVAHTRFRREMRALALCEHPNVVRILDSGAVRGVPFYAMEYVDGVDLGRVAKRLRTSDSFRDALSSETRKHRDEHEDLFRDLPDLRRTPSSSPAFEGDRFRAVAAVVRDAARGLHHIHEAGVVHRDVSPANLMITDLDGRAVVTDLGLAAIDEQAASFSRATRALGTPVYTAPERLLAKGTVRDRRVDVYALGAVLYELLCDRPMFDADDEQRLYHQIVRVDPPPPHRVRSDCPRDLSIVTQKAAAKLPEERYADAAAMADDLDAFLGGRPIRARPQSLVYQLRLLTRRNPVAAAIAAAGLVAVLAFAGWAIVERERARRRAVEAEAERDRVLQLSDKRRLEVLRADSESLWPAHPQNVEALRDWLARADALLSRLPLHEEALASVRRRGRPASSSRLSPEPAADYDFGDDNDTQWWHDALRDLVVGLHELRADDPYGETLAAIRARLAWAETVAERTTTGADVAAEWARAREAIRAHPLYGGLDLEPQLGLVPLGPDPASTLWEFAHARTGQVPSRDPKTRAIAFSAETALIFVLIPGGPAWVGSQKSRKDGPNYDPFTEDFGYAPEEFDLDPFFISKYEMSAAQWTRVSRERPWLERKIFHMIRGVEPALLPVRSATWIECASLLARLGLTLPTEVRWELAARGCTDGPWWTGDTIETLEGRENVAEFGTGKLQPVHAGAPNPFGLHHVHGNAREWTLDSFVWDHQLRAFDSLTGDGLRSPPHEGRRSVRGGTCLHEAVDCRSGSRARVWETNRSDLTGLRPARSIDR